MQKQNMSGTRKFYEKMSVNADEWLDCWTILSLESLRDMEEPRITDGSSKFRRENKLVMSDSEIECSEIQKISRDEGIGIIGA